MLLFKDKEIFENITIDEGQGSTGPCEPSIAISPVDPNFIVAGSVLSNVYTSKDGGRSWKKNYLKSSFGVYGDPVVRFDALGNVYYAHLSNPKNNAYSSEEFLDRIVVQKMAKGDSIWSDGSFPPSDRNKDHDKHWIVASPIDNTLLMAWTEFDKYASKKSSDHSNIFFSKSKDGGVTWTEALKINEIYGDCLDDDLTNEGAYCAIGVDGTYMMVWARDSKIYFNSSTDGGKTWSQKDRTIADQIGGWAMDVPGVDRTNGFPILITDHSNSKNKGRTYMSWTDQRNGKDNTDVWLIYSDDNGVKWSQPMKINNDDSGKHQFFHSMQIDPKTGNIYILFYDRRNHDDNMTDVYMAYSNNGGKRFENIKVSSKSFRNEKTVFFGDYTDISVYNGIIRPIWADQEGKRLRIKTAIIKVK